jgi:acyl-CoA synthetase (AMP-forming)/AMP-acid ligase II
MTEAVPLLAALALNAARYPGRDAFRFLAKGEEVTDRVTFAALLDDTQTLAAGLAARGLRGKPVLLCLPPGIDFVRGLLACLRAGAIAVPAPSGETQHGRERTEAIAANARPAAVLGNLADCAGIEVLDLDALSEDRALPDLPVPDRPAVIQYSSGSTRAPCGIVITHGNLAANLEMIRATFPGSEPGAVGASWLPPSHDMGLVGATLGPVHFGGTGVLMPPMSFMQRPLRWLRAIHEHRATMAGGPNFGYELCVRRVPREVVHELDLSSWHVAFCGSEPIRPAALIDFAAHFAAASFDPHAFLACYGLAETTLLCTAGPFRTIPAPRIAGGVLVSCGQAAPGCMITLRDEQGAEIRDGTGEICVAGPHLAAGKWCGETGRVVPLDTAEPGFLRTGDLGTLVDDELFVLDRIKDVIAIYGRKIHAIDVERPAIDGSHGLVLAAAAFSVPHDKGERLVALCEVSARDLARVSQDTLRNDLRAIVSAATGVAPEVAFLRHGALPRTSSGKIRRHATRADYLAGRLRQ